MLTDYSNDKPCSQHQWVATYNIVAPSRWKLLSEALCPQLLNLLSAKMYTLHPHHQTTLHHSLNPGTWFITVPVNHLSMFSWFSLISRLCRMRFPTRKDSESPPTGGRLHQFVIYFLRFCVLNSSSSAELIWSNFFSPGCPKTVRRKFSWAFRAFILPLVDENVDHFSSTWDGDCHRP